MYPFTCWSSWRCGSSFGISLAIARTRPKLKDTQLRSPTTVTRPRRRSLRMRRRLRAAGFCWNGRKAASSLASSGSDYGEDVLRVAFELGRPEALDRRQVDRRARLGGRELAERGVVQNDVCGHLVGPRSLASPRPQALEERVVGRCAGSGADRRQRGSGHRAQQPETVLALELLERTGQLE